MSATSSIKPGSKEVVLVASGDSRLSANQRCWPAQQHARAGRGEGLRRARRADRAGPLLRSRKEARFHRRPGARDPDLPQDRPRRAPRRRRGGLGVHEPRPRGPDQASRAHPDARQLERPVAGPRRHAQRERVADEGRHPVQLDLERGLQDGFARGAARASGSEAGAIGHDTSHVQAIWTGRSTATTPRIARADAALGDELQRDQAIMGVFDEGCMGMYNAIIHDELLQPDGPLQGAAQAVRALRGDARGPRRRGARRLRAGCTKRGMRFQLGSDEATELTEGQVLDRSGCTTRPCDRRRLRLRRDRHPVPAGPQGRRASPRTSPRGC